MNHRPIILAVCVLAASSWLHAADLTEAESAALLERVKAAAQARSARWNSCRIEWIESATFGPGSVMPPGALTAQEFGEAAAARGIPSTEMKARTPCLLLTHGEWMRYRSRSNSIGRDGTLSFGVRDSAYDGKQSRTLTRTSTGELQGHDNDLARLEESKGIALLPLMAFLRFDNGKLSGRGFWKLRVVNDAATAVGRNCIEIEGPNERLFLDKERDLVLVQRTHLSEGRIISEARVQYVKDGESAWRPSKWIMQHFRKGSDVPDSSCEVRITRFERQVAFKQNDFAITFPAGTHFYDPATHKMRVVEPQPVD